MRNYHKLTLMAALFLVGTTTATMAKENRGDASLLDRAPLPNELTNDRPAKASAGGHTRADTLFFGNIGVDGFAIQADTYTSLVPVGQTHGSGPVVGQG